MDEIDIYHLPLWLSGIYDEIQERCIKTLKEDSDAYGKILNETSQLLDKYDFINTLSARDEIQEPKNLTILEWQALERFMALEEDRRDFEAIQIYLFGCQHTLAMLQLLKII